MKLFCDEAYYSVTVHQNTTGFPWLLMLHGFMGSGEVFDPLLPELKRFCNPVTIDLLGHGKTQCQPDPERFSAGRQTNDLHSILDRLALRPLFLYGYSMGGRLALQAAPARPGRFAGIIVESSHCGIEAETDRQARTALDEERAASIESDFDRFIEQWMTQPLFRSSKKQDKRYTEIMRARQPALMAASLRGFGAGMMPSVCKKLEQLRTPLYLVAGKNDQKYVSRMSGMARSLGNAKLRIVDNAGHRVHADQPHELVRILEMCIMHEL